MARAVLTLVGFLSFALAGCPTDPSGGPGDTRSGACSGDDECSDDQFCNGRERCEPDADGADARGCVAARGRPCLDAQVCEEATDECVTDCGVSRDADGDSVEALECGGDDCDDGDPLRFPGNVEVCDGEDRDEDCDAATFGGRDLDHDGAVDARCCNADAMGALVCGDDCDDTRQGTRPLASEVCNGLDDDCSGEEDDGVLMPAFVDADRDLHGDAPAMACPGTIGFSLVDDDCVDDDRAVHGGRIEICDGIDNDCDGDTDEHARPVTWYRDMDGDGFGAASSGTMPSCEPLGDGYSLLATDCDDASRARSPAAAEICNGVDDDCNGLADFRVGVNDREDDDGDGHADAACGGDDCDDGDPWAFAGAPEICDFRDSDCDGLADRGASPPAGAMADATTEVDWYPDVDLDGHGATSGALRSCEPQLGRVARGDDCDDDDPSVHPGAIDACDGVDDDCDADIDEDAVALAHYADTDGDGDGAGMPTIACRAPAGSTELPGDCAPTDPTRGPGLYELCNGVDEDCDEDIDEEMFRDVDGDGHGDPAAPVVGACMPGDVGRGDDCNDAASDLHPELAEVCNGLDDDCDMEIDEAGAELCVAGSDHGMCVAGSCAFTCPMGQADCDGDATTGCESTLATDPADCGMCSRECGIGGTCSAGACDPIVGVAMAAYHACAWRSGGGVLCWGTDGAGELGEPSLLARSSPVVSTAVRDAAQVCTGLGYTCARRRTGEVACWGTGTSGQRGQGIEPEGPHPEAATIPGLSDAVEIACGYDRACARRASGRVLCWGGGGTAQFGSVEMGPAPREAPGMSDVAQLAMHSGTTAIYAVTTDGRLLTIGAEITGGDASGSVSDVSALFPGPVDRVIPGGVQDGCARLRTGALHCWARGDRVHPWAHADAMLTSTPSAIDMRDWTGVTSLAIAGQIAMCGVTADGHVTCSGSCSSFGLRGDGCALDTAQGTRATGIDDAVSIVAEQVYFCAVRSRGDVVCWGNGPLGSGPSLSAVPVRVVSD